MCEEGAKVYAPSLDTIGCLVLAWAEAINTALTAAQGPMPKPALQA
ncbi:hypothetical protein RAN3_2704 [plant metagenome]|uniref:Uncharacterized protein n=1 Tax=plant metagenome TaxID=1297885 RepID=A0A484VCV6_9ZZZZ